MMSAPLMLVLLAAAVLLSAAALFKAWRSRESLFRVEEQLRRLTRQLPNTFHQIEALGGLYADLRLDRSLPRTRGWAASPDFLAVLVHHVFTMRPGVIVECGSGVSTIVLARCCELNQAGHVYSLEHLPGYAEVTRAELARHDLAHRADVLEAPLVPHDLGGTTWSWYSLDKLAAVQADMLVVDGPPRDTGPLARYPAGPLLFPRLHPRGVAFLDDGHEDHVKGALARWTREIPGLSTESLECEKGCVVIRREGVR